MLTLWLLAFAGWTVLATTVLVVANVAKYLYQKKWWAEQARTAETYWRN